MRPLGALHGAVLPDALLFAIIPPPLGEAIEGEALAIEGEAIGALVGCAVEVEAGDKACDPIFPVDHTLVPHSICTRPG